MPYHWTEQNDETTLTIWPHRSLSPRGFAWFIGVTFGFLLLPLVALLGSPVVWVLLPFMMGALALVWAMLRRSYRDGQLREDLQLCPDRVELVRINPRGAEQRWAANPFWVRLEMHGKGGPVENYLTLTGNDRTVELGAFLSPDERRDLHDELAEALARAKTPPRPDP